jgi:primosomal protein N' (replication factor Y)
MRFLVRSGRGVDLSAYLRAWLEAAAAPKATRVIVDMEPYSFL